MVGGDNAIRPGSELGMVSEGMIVTNSKGCFPVSLGEERCVVGGDGEGEGVCSNDASGVDVSFHKAQLGL